MAKSMHNQHFRKYNSCSTFNLVSQENESEGRERLTSCYGDKNCKKLEETDRHEPLHKTANHGDCNRIINYLNAKSGGIEKHIPTKTMCTESVDKEKADVHQPKLTDSSITGSEKAHVITQNTKEHTKIRKSRIPDKMLAFSVPGDLQEITGKNTEIGTCSYKDGGSVVIENKRVTIHGYSQKNTNLKVPCAKVINLPGSMDELFTVASKYSSIHAYHYH